MWGCVGMAEFTAHIGDGDEVPKFDKDAAERYLKEKEIHKLMGGLLQTLVDNKPTDPVDFLVDTLTKMEESETAAHAKAEVQQKAPAAAPVQELETEPEPEA